MGRNVPENHRTPQSADHRTARKPTKTAQNFLSKIKAVTSHAVQPLMLFSVPRDRNQGLGNAIFHP